MPLTMTLASARGKNFLAKIVVEVSNIVNTANINTISHRTRVDWFLCHHTIKVEHEM